MKEAIAAESKRKLRLNWSHLHAVEFGASLLLQLVLMLSIPNDHVRCKVVMIKVDVASPAMYLKSTWLI
jgi:hypothetical protein